MSGYLTLEEAAEKLGVQYKTVYRLVRSGELPAGKVGRIYRIREEDLDAYFERQKRLVSEQASRAGASPSGGVACSACGTQVLSELSIGGQCEVCGQPICQACWSIHKVRRCKAHREPEPEAQATGRAARTGGHQGQGKMPGTGEAPQETPGRSPPAAKAETPADAVARLLEKGQPAITAEDARLAEDTFLRSFGQRLDGIEELADPLSGLAVPLREARVRHEVEAAEERSGDIPQNCTSRFVLRVGGWGKPKGCLILEARFFSRIHTFSRQEYDAAPISQSELLEFLNAFSEKAGRPECFRVLMLGSPTGWTEGAIRVVAEKGHGKAFKDKRMAVALYDLHADKAYIDEEDERLRPFWPLLTPARHGEVVEQCMERIQVVLEERESLPTAEAARMCDADPSWIREAFVRLERGGHYRIDELQDLGHVISHSSA